MTRTPSPAVSKRWIAHEMKRLREGAGLSQARVAKALGCQVPKISLMENEQRPVQDDDLLKLLVLFDVPGEDRQQYIDEAENAHRKGWWEYYDEHTVPAWLAQFIGLEQGAERIRAYQPAVVHGLLQTPEYAAGIFRGTSADLSEEKIARLVEFRLRRQRMLRPDTGAPELWVVLDEASLRRVVETRETLGAQLDHVVQLCHANDNITVQVMPFDGGGAYEAAYGAFTILGFPFETDPGLVYKERRSGAEFLDSLLEIDDHSLLFQRLSELALTPHESLEMLHGCAEEHARAI